MKRGDIDPVAFSHQIELAFTAIKNRQSNKPLKPEEVQKHLNAIGASVSNKRAPRRPKKNSSKVLPSAGPEVRESVALEGQVPEGTTNHDTGRVLKVRNKRKRSEVKVKSEPDSESSESLKIPKKRSKRSRISKTEESTDSDEYEEPAEDPGPALPNESPRSRHRRRQLEIRLGGGSNENINRLKQRSNTLFDHEGVNEEGKKFYRRNPKEPFKSPPRKPADGKSIKNHPNGKMLRASKICDQQTAGSAMRPYLNSVGFQLRLAEAVRKLVELALPDVKKPKRYKAKNGKPARLVVDPRLRYAQVTLRRVKRALDAFDQWNNSELGAHPVEEDQSGIPFVCLEDYTRKDGWGKN